MTTASTTPTRDRGQTQLLPDARHPDGMTLLPPALSCSLYRQYRGYVRAASVLVTELHAPPRQTNDDYIFFK